MSAIKPGASGRASPYAVGQLPKPKRKCYRVSAGSFPTLLTEDVAGASKWFEFLDLINPAHLAFPIERKRKQQNQEDQRTDLL